jgi:hypothetical protein
MHKHRTDNFGKLKTVLGALKISALAITHNTFVNPFCVCIKYF